jgi:hypothetical protein
MTGPLFAFLQRSSNRFRRVAFTQKSAVHQGPRAVSRVFVAAVPGGKPRIKSGAGVSGHRCAMSMCSGQIFVAAVHGGNPPGHR